MAKEIFDQVKAMQEQFRFILVQKTEFEIQTEAQKKLKTKKQKRSRQKNSCKPSILGLPPLSILQIITKGKTSL